MWRYVRMLRLEDQYIQFSAALFAGIVVGNYGVEILLWAAAVTCISLSGFVVNEIVDHNDTDRYSWNPAHIRPDAKLDYRIAWGMFWLLALLGVALSALSGYFLWGVGSWIVATAYSLPPVRLKSRFGLDMLAQLLVWWIVPFVAPVWGHVDAWFALCFIGTTSMLIWSAFFPYQIADYAADKKAGLGATHVKLGVRASALAGLLLGIAGVTLFFVFRLWYWTGWATAGFVYTIIALYLYVRWLRLPTDERILQGMQSYSRLVKPTGNIFPFYVMFLWIILR